MLTLHIFTIALICVQEITCLRKVYCAADDETCLSNAANERVFPKLLAGIPGIDPSEPLCIERLEINLPNLKVSLFNATLTGVKDCVMRVKKNTEDTQFEYQPRCPRLTVESQYEAEGKIDAVTVEGKGTFKNTYENYLIKIRGNQKKVEFGDCKQHIRILDYIIDSDLQGKLTYDYKNLAFGDSGRCKYNAITRSRYYDRFEEITRTPIVEGFIKKFMDNVKDFHLAIPVEELYYKYV